MNRVRIGIVGAGFIGNMHARILAEIPRADVVAIYDRQSDRAQALARRVEAEAVPSLTTLLERVDAVYITAPNRTHPDIALAALDRGCHVFCEKPMAVSLDAARAMLEASEHSDRVFQVGHNRRFAPVYQKVKELINTDHLRPHSAHIKMNRGELLDPPWVGRPDVTGGFLYETTIHMLDMVRWLFGEVTSVMVVGSSHEYGEVDDFSMLLTFASGMHATLASSADASWFFPFERIEVFAHHATIETQEMVCVTYTEGLDPRVTTFSFHQLSREDQWGYRREDDAFIRSILDGAPVAVSARDGYKAVELVEACYRSLRTGERIWFDA
ncbi:MAG: gfo/Idh/MocA family oxidoreductase [Acidobacteria bacterium]|nr:MAG: gfo/Idh/MocA family oxidoreductase [Acidobacteriota bacterium]